VKGRGGLEVEAQETQSACSLTPFGSCLPLQVYGAVTMNNSLVLGLFLLVVYLQHLEWWVNRSRVPCAPPLQPPLHSCCGICMTRPSLPSSSPPTPLLPQQHRRVYSSEVLIIVVGSVLIGWLGYSDSNFKTKLAIPSLALYPVSLLTVYLLDTYLGWQ
jgi:hypothetical protein